MATTGKKLGTGIVIVALASIAWFVHWATWKMPEDYEPASVPHPSHEIGTSVLSTDALDDRGRCSLIGEATLFPRGRMKVAAGNEVSPSCVYRAKLDPWEEIKCVLEFPTVGPIGAAAVGARSRLALAYYSRRQGGIVSMTVDANEGPTVLILDSKWCLLRAHEGIRLVLPTPSS